jgi:tricorn protease-like protein
MRVVSNRVVFLYEYEGDGFNRAFSPVNLYLLGMDENQVLDSKIAPLERLETAYPVVIEPSGSGDFAALQYATHTYVPETDRYKWNEWHIRLIDIEKKSLLSVDIKGHFERWINDDKFMYYDNSSSKLTAFDVRTMSTQELDNIDTISPNEQSMGYSENIGFKKQQIILNNLTDSSQIILQEQGYSLFFLSWSPNSRYLIYALKPYTNYQQIKVYELETGKTTSLLDISVNSQPYKGYQSLSWSPDGSLFVIGIMKYEKIGPLEVADALDYFLCDFEKCTLINPASSTSCSNAIFTSD